MVVLSIDPGPEVSAALLWDGERIRNARIYPNEELVWKLLEWSELAPEQPRCFIETIQNYGSLMGASTIRTVFWTGRFYQRWTEIGAKHPELVARPTVKVHICGNNKANDSHVREALIERIGQPGTKKNPGPTHGIASHLWAALAVGVYGYDTLRLSEERS